MELFPGIAPLEPSKRVLARLGAEAQTLGEDFSPLHILNSLLWLVKTLNGPGLRQTYAQK